MTARPAREGAPGPGVTSAANSAALDQWRGLALVFVLISHGFFFTDKVHGIGRVGVNLFFFISGILVFRSLGRERVGGWWDLARGFWYRRVRRLYPALLAYVILMIPVVYVLQSSADPRLGLDSQSYFHMLPYALTYLVNYAHFEVRSLGHLWSLSCEMQFYVIAPLIFLLGGRTLLTRNVVWGIVLCGLVALGLSQIRSGLLGYERYHFEFAVWPMMLGFFCEFQQARLRLVPGWLVWPGSIAALLAFLAGSVAMVVGYEFKKLVIASGTLVMVPCLFSYLNGRSIPGVPGRTLAWLGERTYSIYLWQQPLTICNYLPALLHPVGALVSVFVGAASFHFFERPFLSSARRK